MYLILRKAFVLGAINDIIIGHLRSTILWENLGLILNLTWVDFFPIFYRILNFIVQKLKRIGGRIAQKLLSVRFIQNVMVRVFLC